MRSHDNVDFSQRTAQPDFSPGRGTADKRQADDEIERELESTIEMLRQVVPYFWRLHGDELEKLKDELREAIDQERRGTQKPESDEEAPDGKTQLQRDDEFWSDPEELRRFSPPRRL